MPTEIKQRKKTQSQKQNDEMPRNSPANGHGEAQKTEDGENSEANKTSSGPDIKGLMCLLSLVACGVLSW